MERYNPNICFRVFNGMKISIKISLLQYYFLYDLQIHLLVHSGLTYDTYAPRDM